MLASRSVEDIDNEFARVVAAASESALLADPNLLTPKAASPDDDLSLYQLNARYKELDAAGSYLNDLWLVKGLCDEIRTSLDPDSSGDYICDRDELAGVLGNIKKLRGKIDQLSLSHLAVVPALLEYFGDIVSSFSAMAARIFRTFVPLSGPTYDVASLIEVNGSQLYFGDFYTVLLEFEAFSGTHEVSEMLTATRVAWERDLLDSVIAKKSILEQEPAENCVSLRAVPAPASSLSSFFASLAAFVRLVDATGLQALRNVYSTKISTALVDVVSENIEAFMDSRQQLTDELTQTVDAMAKNGWAIPIRNLLFSSEGIHKSLQDLHANWVIDKYIDRARDIFSDGFSESLGQLRDVQQTVEILRPPAPSEEQVKPDTVSEEIDWDEDWGSDVDESAKRASVHSDAWDNNWDDNWDNESHEQKSLRSVRSVRSVQAAAVAIPKEEGTEIVTIKQSGVLERIKSLVYQFEAESNGASAGQILDAVFAMALTSYPPLSELLLLLNDMRAVDPHLAELADREWGHTKQEIFNRATDLLLETELNENASEPEGADLSVLRGLFSSLVDSDLHATNPHELKTLVISLLNVVNAVALNLIFQCLEITEYQLEIFTGYLEDLQSMEGDTLSKFGEQLSVLATSNKVMQTKFLINNHLKSIMEYFYQGELYDFTTDELIKVIKSVFIPSELRENCIQEIVDIRNS